MNQGQLFHEASKQDPAMDEDARLRESRRLRAKAESKLIEKLDGSSSTHEGTLDERIFHSLRKLDGKDILKRNTARRTRYLMMFPGALQLPNAKSPEMKQCGSIQIGQLENLDTSNPRLVLNVGDEGSSIELLGTLVYPKHPFLSMRETKTGLVCEDVFDAVIVFSEWRVLQYENVSTELQGRLSGRIWKTARHSRQIPASGVANRQLVDEEESEDVDRIDETPDPNPTPVRRPRRASAVQARKRMEASSNEDTDGDTDELDDGEKSPDPDQVPDADDEIQVVTPTDPPRQSRPRRASATARKRARRDDDTSASSSAASFTLDPSQASISD